MNTTDAQPKRMSLGRKLLIGLLIWMGASVAVVAAFVASFFFLDSNASMIRRQVMSASGRDWDTKVQVSVSPVTMALARTVMRFVPEVPDEAHFAMRAMRSASVGVYELARGERAVLDGDWLHEADARMAKRGFTRLVRVADRKQSVALYIPEDYDDGDRLKICVAVCSGKELVVVSAETALEPLMVLIEREGAFHGAPWKKKLALR
jgi:hypothetical protein